MSEQPFVDAVDPEEAFDILSDGTRVAILRALWEAEDREATFSELREAADVADSGRFNYHLGTFEGTFVERTDDGYRLRLAGEQVVGAILAGAYTQEGSVDPVGVGEPCPLCDGALTFRYERESAVLDCEDCGVVSRFGVPPGVMVGYEREEFPSVIERYTRSRVRRARAGFCEYCEGRTDARLTTAAETIGDETDPDVDPADVPMVVHTCRRCGKNVGTNLGIELLDHPAVAAFFWDHGVDLRERPVWQFAASTEDEARIVSRDPLRASVTYTRDEDELTLTVDDTASVQSIDRTDG